MNKILITIVVILGLYSTANAQLRVLTVPQGGTGANTLTGCLEGNGTGAITGTGVACGSGTVSSGLQGQNAFYNSNGTTVSGTSTLFISQNSNVGIGTTTPQSKLVISETVSNTLPLVIEGTMPSSNNYTGIGFQRTGEGEIGRISMIAEPITGERSFQFLTDTGSAVTEAMRIRGSGNVGIGTTTPLSQLSIESTIGSTIALSSTKNDSSWTLGSNMGGIDFYGSDTSGGTRSGIKSYIRQISGNTTFGGSTGLAFGITQQAQTSPTQAMTITESATVGIGTTSPNTLLTLEGLVGVLTINDTGALGTSGAGILLRRDGANKWLIQNNALLQTTDQLDFLANGTPVMSLLQGGNVGIGTTSPQTKLSIQYGAISADTLYPILTLGGSHAAASGGTSIDFTVNGNTNSMSRIGSVISGTSGELVLYTTTQYNTVAPTEKLRITGAGNVGIGTTTPDYKLKVGGGSNIPHNSVASSYDGISVNPTTAHAQISVRNTSDVEIGMIAHSVSGGIFGTWTNHPLLIRTNNATRATIDTSGNFGIGTTSPTNKLHVAGTGSFLGGKIESLTTTGYAGIELRSDTGSGYIYQTGLGNVANPDTLVIDGTESANGISFWNGGNRMRITSAGNVGIGTTTPNDILTVYGGGIGINPGGASRPTCTADTRGDVWNTFGGAGVADTFAVCQKDAADAYSWVTK